jgi:hypothetical protein
VSAARISVKGTDEKTIGSLSATAASSAGMSASVAWPEPLASASAVSW